MDTYFQKETLVELDQQSHRLLAETGNCAQTSFGVLDNFFNLDGRKTMQALTVMPGVALRGETCGAVLGCLMAIGLACGPEKAGSRAAFLEAIPPARRFCRAFEKEAGSTLCAELLKSQLGQAFDLSRSTDLNEYVHCGGVESCGQLVSRAVQIAAEIIAQEQEQPANETGMWYA